MRWLTGRLVGSVHGTEDEVGERVGCRSRREEEGVEETRYLTARVRIKGRRKTCYLRQVGERRGQEAQHRSPALRLLLKLQIRVTDFFRFY